MYSISNKKKQTENNIRPILFPLPRLCFLSNLHFTSNREKYIFFVIGLPLGYQAYSTISCSLEWKKLIPCLLYPKVILNGTLTNKYDWVCVWRCTLSTVDIDESVLQFYTRIFWDFRGIVPDGSQSFIRWLGIGHHI